MNDHEIYDYDDTLVITNTRRKQLEEEALAHHGILGMKWGIRRYQNEDGSLTELGQRHYDMLERKQELEYDRRNRKEEADVERQRLKYQRASEKQGLYNQRDRDVYDFANQERERKQHRKNVLTAVVVGALAVGGGIALHHYLKNKGNTPIDAPELTTTISTGKDNVQRLLFNTNGINNGTANYNFGGSGKNASTFGQTKVDDLKKLMDSSSKAKTLSKGKIKIENLAKKGNWGVAADDKQDVLEKLDSFTSLKKPVSISRNGKWEADNGTVSDLSNILAKRRQAQLNSNTAADMLSKQRAFERRKNLAGQIFEPGVRADKAGKVDWKKLAFNTGMKIPEGNDILSYAEKMTNPLTSRSTSTVNPADLLARKAAYDTSVSNLGSNLDKTLKKFKHSNIGDAYDMIDSKLMHTAMAISSRRRAQLENRDDYLMHYGRKGMKWGEDIFAEDELKKRQSGSQSQYAQQLQAEAARRKYGGTEQHYDTGRGAQVREQQRKQREAQAKYGGQEQHYDTGRGAQVREQQRKQREAQAIEEQRKRRDATINVMGKQVNTSDIEKYKNSPPVQAVEAQARDIENAKRKQSAALVKEYPKTAATVAATDSAITKAFESDNSDRIQRDLEKTANISDTDSVFDAVENSDEYDKLFRDHSNEKKSTGSDDITGRDIALGLFTKTSPRTAHNVNKAADAVVDAGGKAYETQYKDRELSDKNDTAKDAYIKSQAKKRMHDDIDTKYQNGELDQTYTVGGQKVKIHPSEEDIARLKKNADERVDKDYDDYKVIKQWRQRTNHS